MIARLISSPHDPHLMPNLFPFEGSDPHLGGLPLMVPKQGSHRFFVQPRATLWDLNDPRRQRVMGTLLCCRIHYLPLITLLIAS